MNRSLSRLEAALLVAAPVLLLAGGTILVRFDDEGYQEMLAGLAAHPDRSSAGWLLALAGAALIVVPTFGLARLVGADRPRLAGVSTVLTALGWASVSALAMAGIMMAAMATGSDQQAQAQTLDRWNDGLSSFVFLASALGAVGYIVLAVGLARSRVAPVGAAVLIGLGGAATLLVMGGPIRFLLLVSVGLLLAGHGWALRGLVGGRAVPVGTPQPV